MLLPSRRSRLPIIAIGSLLLVATIAAFAVRVVRTLDAYQVREVAATRLAKLAELSQLERIVGAGPIPQSWDAGLYLSESALNTAFQTLSNIDIPLDAARVLVESITIDTSPGATEITLSLVAFRRSDETIQIHLDCSALLLFKRIVSAESGARAEFRVSMLTVKPRVEWYKHLFTGTEFVNEVSSALAADELAKYLTFSIPLDFEFSQPISLDSTTRVSGAYDVSTTLPGVSLDTSVRFSIPVTTANGVWLLASTSNSVDDGRPVSELTSISNLRNTGSNFDTHVLDPGSGIALWINSTVLNDPIEKFNAMNPSQRTITAAVSNITGRLVDEQVEVLGQKGGFTSTLRSAQGSVLIGPVATEWHTGSGMRGSLPFAVKASAIVDSNLDPVVGGGIGFDSTLHGNLEHVVDFTLIPRLVRSGPHFGLALGPVFTCNLATITIETTGEVKLGIRQPVPLVEKSVPAMFLMTSTRHAFNTAQAIPGTDWNISWHWGVPSIQVAENGYLIRSDFLLAKAGTKINSADEGAIISSLQDTWRREASPDCPGDRRITVLFAGQDFGPNNLVVKALGDLFTAIGRTRENIQVTFDRVQRIIKHPEQVDEVARDFRDDAKDALREAEKDTNRVIESMKPSCVIRGFHKC